MTSRPARYLAATCLVLTALLSLVSVVLQPAFSADTADRLADIEAAGTTATVSALTFGLAQLPFLVAVVAVAALAHRGAPRAAWTGGVLGVLGGFAHAVFAGVSMAYLALAADAAHRSDMAAVITRVEAGPAKVFMGLGLLGTVLGLVVLGVALFRSRAVPRWIPVALWAFVVLEFGVSGLSAWASLASGLVYLVSFVALAAQVARPARTPHRPLGEPLAAPSATGWSAS